MKVVIPARKSKGGKAFRTERCVHADKRTARNRTRRDMARNAIRDSVG